MSSIMVSIVCTSYNYESYIQTAIDSFLKQKTNFKIEIVIVDDASTDNSVNIIKDYEKKYPDLFRVFINEKNKGLTQTWIDICKQVRGKYIARCDADDYWIDPFKLQKQVDLLESTPESEWCNTNFNIIDENGELLHQAVFTNGPIPYANTYEKMLATKGMTLTSSWLVNTKLMQEVNEIIDPTSVDDGYPMQLEFFNRTKLSYIQDVTVAYRMSVNSDSRPTSQEKALYRIEGLLKTQKFYLNKYRNHKNTYKIAELLLERDTEQEIRIYHMGNQINYFMNESLQLQKDILAMKSELSTQQVTIEQLNANYQAILNSRKWRYATKIASIYSKIRNIFKKGN